MAADGLQGAIQLTPGNVLLGRYEVLRVLGRGAMGEVLEVRDRQSDTHYALKRVPPEVARQRGQMQAIRANFELVSGLTHPHIAVTRFLETDAQTGDVFVLMDLVRGRDLNAWAVDQRQALGDSEAPLPMRVVLAIAEQIAAALDYAHAQPAGMAADGTIKRYGILHRDLKPENVMVEDARQYRAGRAYVKLVDFGLAAEIQSSLKSQTQNVTGVNPASGTPLYMAPEQWERRRLSRAIDQWALAVLVYEMLEGRTPFHGVTITDLREQILKGRPAQPEQMTPAQWNALQVALRADRGQRYRSCIALVKTLAEADQITRGTLQVVELPLPEVLVPVQRPREAPRIAALDEQTIEAGRTLTVQVLALDPNQPRSELRYELGTSAPDGAKIDRRTGKFQWTPPRDYRPGKTSVPLRVSTDDSRTPTATESLVIDVLRPAPAATDFAGVQAGQVWEDNGLKLTFCWCPPGAFTMGSSPSETDRHVDEDQVQVTLKGFWLGKCEVTQDEWQQVLGTEPWKGQNYVSEGTNYPATFVSWDDVAAFCVKLTDQERKAGRLPEGWEYRLPTEAQWEYACRAGTTTRYSFGDDAATLGLYAWYDKNAWDIDEKYAHGVGQKKANAWGLHDLHGNVFEWCSDCYDPKLPGGRDPRVDVGSYRVFRGGCWNSPASDGRSAFRGWYGPAIRNYSLGFRLAVSPSGK